MINMEAISAADPTITIKGKRSKRPRPSSSTSSNSANGLNSSPTASSTTETNNSTTTTHEEDNDDMAANCLILLARGSEVNRIEEENNNNNNNNNDKLTSRKFTEMITTTTSASGKVGIYVYECKTCGRNFPSFQALGGHRASHKKPKLIDRRNSHDLNAIVVAPPVTTQSSNNNGKGKVHECSICGAVFASGQALGGHMRRHRSVINRSDSNSTSEDEIGEKITRRNDVLVLDLDLNLPAPAEEDHSEMSFRDLTNQQPPRVIFSVAAAVVV